MHASLCVHETNFYTGHEILLVSYYDGNDSSFYVTGPILAKLHKNLFLGWYTKKYFKY